MPTPKDGSYLASVPSSQCGTINADVCLARVTLDPLAQRSSHRLSHVLELAVLHQSDLGDRLVALERWSNLDGGVPGIRRQRLLEGCGQTRLCLGEGAALGLRVLHVVAA